MPDAPPAADITASQNQPEMQQNPACAAASNHSITMPSGVPVVRTVQNREPLHGVKRHNLAHCGAAVGTSKL